MSTETAGDLRCRIKALRAMWAIHCIGCRMCASILTPEMCPAGRDLMDRIVAADVDAHHLISDDGPPPRDPG